MVLVASVNAFWRYLKVLWYVASSIVRQANEQGVTDTGLGENQELPPASNQHLAVIMGSQQVLSKQSDAGNRVGVTVTKVHAIEPRVI